MHVEISTKLKILFSPIAEIIVRSIKFEITKRRLH